MPHTAFAERGSKQATDTAICPFQVDVPEAELTELRGRINATRWPERETVADATQGVQLATMQALAPTSPSVPHARHVQRSPASR